MCIILQIWHRKIGSGKEIANGVHSWFHLLHLALIQLKFLLISDSIYIYWSFPHWFECYHLICLFICGSIPSLLFYKSFCLILRYGTLFLIMVVLKHVLVYRRMSLPSSFFLFCFFFKLLAVIYSFYQINLKISFIGLKLFPWDFYWSCIKLINYFAKIQNLFLP